MIPCFSRRRFRDLSKQEVLALAISGEEDEGRIYRWYAEGLRDDYLNWAAVFEGMVDGEEHRRRFDEIIPLIRHEHVAGFS